MEKDEIEKTISKISNEIEGVRGYVLSAKHELLANNYEISAMELMKAEKLSTCGYCRTKLQKLMADIYYIKSICSIGYKTCSDIKNNTAQEMQEFINKLPSISEIQKNKATGTEMPDIFKIFGDAVNDQMKAVDVFGKEIGKAWAQMLKL